MLGTDAYAEVVDRHVELAGSLAWLGSLLDQSELRAYPCREESGWVSANC